MKKVRQAEADVRRQAAQPLRDRGVLGGARHPCYAFGTHIAIAEASGEPHPTLWDPKIFR